MRFVHERDRTLYVFAHRLLRVTLGRYLDVDPATIRFSVNRYGRPELAPADGTSRLRFNLSHTSGLAACVVANVECGVDVERRDPRAGVEAVAPRVLAREELDVWNGLDASSRLDAFLRLWTLKEAYAKARGIGLSIPLAQLAFSCVETSPQCTFGPTLDDDPVDWSWWTGRPTPAHHAAVALRNKRHGTLTVLRSDSTLRNFSAWCHVQFP